MKHLARTVLVAAGVACNMAELDDVSQEWERLTSPLATVALSSTGISTTSYWTNTCGGIYIAEPDTPQTKRTRAARLVKEAEETEHRERTESRWRALIKACFPVKK